MAYLTRRPGGSGRHHYRALQRGAVVLAVSTAAFALAACGGGSPAASSTSGGVAASGNGSTKTAAYHPVTNYAAYLGNPKGTKVDPSLPPVTIGVFNEQGGSLDIAPQWTIGQKVGAEFINAHGGIDGHKLVLDDCFSPDTVAQSATCGQEFANDSSVSIVDMGAVLVGNSAFEGALQPKQEPITYSVAIGGTDATYPYGYIFMGDTSHVEAQWATAMQLLKVHSVSIVYPTSSGTAGVDITVDALKYVGIKASNIHVEGFDPSDTDFTSILQAADVGHTGFFIDDAQTASQCSDTYLAEKELGIHELTGVNAPCDTSQAAAGDGGKLPKDWYYLTANPLNGDTGDPSIPALHAVFTTYGEKTWESDAWSGDSFGQILTSAQWLVTALKQAGNPTTSSAVAAALTPAKINAIGKAFKGPVAQGAPSLDCGGFPKTPAVCNDRVSFFRNTVPATTTSPGVMTPLARWVTPPKGFTIPANLL